MVEPARRSCPGPRRPESRGLACHRDTEACIRRALSGHVHARAACRERRMDRGDRYGQVATLRAVAAPARARRAIEPDAQGRGSSRITPRLQSAGAPRGATGSVAPGRRALRLAAPRRRKQALESPGRGALALATTLARWCSGACSTTALTRWPSPLCSRASSGRRGSGARAALGVHRTGLLHQSPDTRHRLSPVAAGVPEGTAQSVAERYLGIGESIFDYTCSLTYTSRMFGASTLWSDVADPRSPRSNSCQCPNAPQVTSVHRSAVVARRACVSSRRMRLVVATLALLPRATVDVFMRYRSRSANPAMLGLIVTAMVPDSS